MPTVTPITPAPHFDWFDLILERVVEQAIEQAIAESTQRAEAELEAERDPVARARRAREEIVHTTAPKAETPVKPIGGNASTSSITREAARGALLAALIVALLEVPGILSAGPEQRAAAIANALRAVAGGSLVGAAASTVYDLLEKAISEYGPDLVSLSTKDGVTAVLKAAAVSTSFPSCHRHLCFSVPIIPVRGPIRITRTGMKYTCLSLFNVHTSSSSWTWWIDH